MDAWYPAPMFVDGDLAARLGAIFKGERERQRLSLEELEERVSKLAERGVLPAGTHVGAKEIGRIERAALKRHPKRETLIALAAALDLPEATVLALGGLGGAVLPDGGWSGPPPTIDDALAD